MADCLRGRFRGRSPRAYLGIAGGPTTVLCPWRRFRRRSPWACHGVARGTTASQFLWWGLRWRSSRKPLYLHERMVHREFSSGWYHLANRIGNRQSIGFRWNWLLETFGCAATFRAEYNIFVQSNDSIGHSQQVFSKEVTLFFQSIDLHLKITLFLFSFCFRLQQLFQLLLIILDTLLVFHYIIFQVINSLFDYLVICTTNMVLLFS